MGASASVSSGRMDAPPQSRIESLLVDFGFEGWGVRLQGRRLRCPHGLLIGLAEECPVGCISPLVVLGLLDPAPFPAVNV